MRYLEKCREISTLKPVRERFPSSPLSYRNKLGHKNIVVSLRLVYPFVVTKDFCEGGKRISVFCTINVTVSIYTIK